MNCNKIKWFQIYRSNNVGPISFQYLQSKFKDPNQALEFIAKNHKITIKPMHEIEEELQKINAYNAQIISIFDAEYPAILKEIPDAPAFLTVKGNINLLNKSCLGVVGSRNASMHSIILTKKFITYLKEKFVIISGLARGIDACAHITSQPNTIAVMANGINVIYPEENTKLYHDIINNGGLIVTEAPYGAEPNSYWFPSRNRIIAGMSKSVLVIEAALKSGSLITAQYANTYNRNVYAIPGSPLDPRAQGANQLIAQGATLVQQPEDLNEDMHEYSLFINEIDNYEFDNSYVTNSIKLSKEDIYNYISFVPITVEALSENLECSIGILRALLAELELDGYIKHMFGNKVVKIK